MKKRERERETNKITTKKNPEIKNSILLSHRNNRHDLTLKNELTKENKKSSKNRFQVNKRR